MVDEACAKATRERWRGAQILKHNFLIERPIAARWGRAELLIAGPHRV